MQGIIVGAGIGGLSTAIALRMRGMAARVYEAAPHLSPIGTGILVPPNAMDILNRYRLSDRVQESGHPIETLAIVDAGGKPISKSPAAHTGKGHTLRTVAIHRGLLHRILLDAMEPGSVVTGRDCVRVEHGPEGTEAIFADGTASRGDFLIGADGIHSKVRASIFPDSRLRHSGQACWRGIAAIDLPPAWRPQLTESWGCGTRFGFVEIAPGQVYWYATQRSDMVQKSATRESAKAKLSACFGQFLDPVPEIIARTDEASIIHGEILDLAPLKQWFSGRVMLIGDAAHAATPNLGQGGAQAIEDSWVLAREIAEAGSLRQAFESFQATRRAKVDWIVNTSRQIGRAANLSGHTACRFRNLLFRSIPPFLAERQSRRVYEASY